MLSHQSFIATNASSALFFWRQPNLGFTFLLIVVSLGLSVALLFTLRAHRGATETDSVDRLRSRERRSLQIAQNVWLRDLSTVLSRAVSQRNVADIMAQEGKTATGAASAEIALLEAGHTRITFVAAHSPEQGIGEPRPAFDLEDRTPTADAIRTGQNVLVVSSPDMDERYPDVWANQTRLERAEASLPLIDSDGRVIGAMVFGCDAENAFDDDQLVVFETATELCARALDRVRLYELEYEARRLAENLQTFTTVLAATETRVDVANAIVNESVRVLGADAAAVWVPDDDSMTVLVGQDLSSRPAGYKRTAQSLVSAPTDAFRTRKIIVLESQEQIMGSYPDFAHLVKRDGDQAWVALPLAIGGEASAVLFAVFRTARTFSTQDRSLLSTMGLQAALAFERGRLRENDLKEADIARKLAAAVGGLTAAATKVDVLAAFIDALPALGALTGSLALVGEDGTTVDVQGGSELSPYLNSEWLTRPITAKTPLISAARSGEQLFVHDRFELNKNFDLNAVEMFDDSQRSWVAMPLYAGGRPLGALGLSFEAPQRFDDGQRVRLASFAALCANALTRAARFELEHSIAITLQSTLLPKRLKPLADVELAAHYSPGTRELSVGGDWYDVIELSEERFLLVVGDVVGHGIESAAAMGKLATATRALAQVEDAPAALLRQLDRVAAADTSTQFASMAIVLVDRRAGELRYSLAGHPAPLIKLAGGTVHSLDGARSIPLGGIPVDRPEQTMPFDGHISLLLYTDGLTERRADHIDARVTLLHSAFHDANVPIQDLPRMLIARMLNGGDQNDDIAVLCASFAPVENSFSRLVPSHVRYLASLRHDLQEWLAGAGVAADDSADCLIAVAEAVTNAVEHGNDIKGRPINMHAYYIDGKYSFSVIDHGTWRQPSDSGGARGRGLTLIGLLMDDLEIEQSNHGTTVSFTKTMLREGSI